MKKIIFSCLISLVWFHSFAQSEVKNDGELGSSKDYYNACWEMDKLSLTDNKDHVFAGDYSFLVSEGSRNSPSYLKSPWIELGEGNIKLDIKTLEKLGNGTIYAYFIRFDSENKKTGEGSDPELIDYYQLSKDELKKDEITDVRFKMPNEMVGEVAKIYLIFEPNGKDEGMAVDNVVIPGKYVSDPSSNCFPKVEIKDTDGDGVADEEDDYPEDKYKAFNNYLTPKGFGTLMFEDLWPAKGDYDFNDLVVGYKINRVTNAGGDVVEVVIDILPRAAGAGYSNGFGIEFTGISPARIENVEGTKISSNSIHELMRNGLEEGNEHATIIVFDKVANVLTHPGGGAVGINTDPKFSLQSGEMMRIVMHIRPEIITTGPEIVMFRSREDPVRLKDLTMENFNPFLIVNQKRSVEVHLPGKLPTAHADKSLFGTKDDNSNGDESSYYKGKENGLPWGLNVTESIPYMVNKVDITQGYNMFYKWAASGGEAYPDWYLEKGGYRENKVLLNAK